MAVALTVEIDRRSASDMSRLLNRIAVECRKDIKTIVRQSARRMCKNLAYVTQPFGDSDKAREQGRKAVAKDAGKVFDTIGEIYKNLAAQNSSLARALYAAAKAGEMTKVRALAKKLGINTPIAARPDPAFHQARRNSRGRVPGGAGNPSQLLLAGQPLTTYIERIQRRVGLSKQGWADCARQLGGTRGINSWIARRHIAGRVTGTVTELGGNLIGYKLENLIPWIDTVCRPSQVRIAEKFEDKTLGDLLRRALDANARRNARRSA